ncbi:hypothetical protein AMATHDRAFT_10356 [Amanita thiersii Skay4041]|uniref:CCHC-type domain-containing protein n=1 Tax=Amanita thiersii Skay4041 TaxID=703135 RepID=A0A2A9NBF1_9AGAR|nr:hypothetical protein AMATHDRAFT_10356 [Amanita thiersii Skay4041]
MMVGGGTGGTNEPDWTLDHAMAQIQQLVSLINNLQHTIAQQGQTITQLQAQSTVSQSGTGTPFQGPKMATPPIYDGAMTTCEGFINSCRLYISAKPQEFPNLQVKITWVLGFMQTGMAQLDIYKAFGDPNKQATAIQEITTIKQGSKSGEEHVQLFKQCYMRSGYGEIAGIHKFKHSLNTPLLDKCMAIPNLPITLDKWYDLIFTARGGSSTGRQTSTSQRTSQQRQTQNNTPQRGFNQQAQRQWQPPVTQQQFRSPVQSIPRDPNAMQVDCNWGPIRCYNCRQTGHMARTCPNPRQQQMRLVSMWNSGTDADREELWRMMGRGVQAGGGAAHNEEVSVPTPTTIATVAQPSTIPFNPLGFQFGQ